MTLRACGQQAATGFCMGMNLEALLKRQLKMNVLAFDLGACLCYYVPPIAYKDATTRVGVDEAGV